MLPPTATPPFVSARRAGAKAGMPLAQTGKAARVSLVLSAGQPGETCINLVDARHDVHNALLTSLYLRRCLVRLGDAQCAGHGAGGRCAAPRYLAGNVGVPKGRGRLAGRCCSLALDAGDIGYVEFAGWAPGARRCWRRGKSVRAGAMA